LSAPVVIDPAIRLYQPVRLGEVLGVSAVNDAAIVWMLKKAIKDGKPVTIHIDGKAYAVTIERFEPPAPKPEPGPSSLFDRHPFSASDH
jgi:hypothetical protein